MSIVAIQPAPFFASKNRAFWNLQLVGWGGAFLLRALNSMANGLPYDQLLLILVTTIMGFSLSLILSVIYRQLIAQKPIVTWGGSALALLAAVIVHASIDTWVQNLYYVGAETTFAQRFVGISFIPLALLGGWSALYYAINFFLTLEQQSDRLERLEAQTTAAQLAMLRYQLNPHFLFNTLNSISTLVLLKQTEPANAMLTRLSGFLRHTLITEPGSLVSLEQEVETLQLYLDIERMRFEERLRTQFDIEPAAMKAILPSMLLQPLVENAIKYAVTPQEEGARIAVTARIVGQRLRVEVADSGPGVDGSVQLSMLEYTADGEAKPTSKTESTGVGLANIRSRLAQGYDKDHVFETRSEPGGGFTVLIEIPYQRSAKHSDASAANTAPKPPLTASGTPPVSSEETASDNVINLTPQRVIGKPS